MKLIKIKFATFQQWLISFLIFLVPSNLFYKPWESSAYVHGLRVDYLIPKFYLSDVFILLLLLSWLVELFTSKRAKLSFTKARWLLTLAVVASVIAGLQFFVAKPLAAGWYGVKLLEMGLLIWFLSQHRALLSSIWTNVAFYLTVLFQAGLAIYQFVFQKALFGYWFLGEPKLVNQVGFDRANFLGAEKVLPYGTTAHPNILGGGLAIYFLIISFDFWWSKKKTQWQVLFYWLTALLTTIALFFTQSFSAGLTLLIGAGLLIGFKNKKQIFVWLKNIKIFPVLLALFLLIPLVTNWAAKTWPANSSLQRRAYLNQAAWQMFIQNPIAGVGLNNFTARVEEYSNHKEVVRFVQPAHHIGLLWLAETGLLGLVLIFVLVKLIQPTKNQAWPLILSILLPLASWDHYLLSQQSGMLIFALLHATL